MDFGHDMRVQWGGDVDDGIMQSTTFPPAMEFGRLVREQLPQGALYNPGPTSQDATTDMYGAPSGELIIGAHDSKIHDPSYTPIVHSLLVKDLGGKGKFYPKGHLVAVFSKVEQNQPSRRRLMKRHQEQPTPCIFQRGLNNIQKGVTVDDVLPTRLYPLSEGVIFPKTSDTEHVAITVHDHAEVITCDPRTVRDKLNDGFYQNIQRMSPEYYREGSTFTANVNDSLWVWACPREGHEDEAVFVPVVNPVEARRYLYHIGTLKQAYTPDDDTWVVSFAPL